MTTLQQVDRCLSGPYPNDLWSDYMFEEVTALMQKLTPTEFAELRSTWPYKSTGWQTRCAETLPWAAAPRQEIASILLEMIRLPNDELTITAADTLREFDPAMVAALMTPETEQRLREVASRNPGLSAGAIQRFLAGLPMERPSQLGESPMPKRLLTEQVVQAVEQHPQRWQHVTRESALSLPIPAWLAGQTRLAEQEGLAFFWYPGGGPIQNRTVMVPTYRVQASLSRLGDITFAPVRPADLGLDIAAGQPLGRPTIGGSVPAAEMKQVRADFYRATDRVAALYAQMTTTPNAFPDAGERAELAAYRAAFLRLAVVVLLPAYRALSPHFFAWLDAVLGPEL